MDEETGGMKYAEEGPDLSTEPLKSLENWCQAKSYSLVGLQAFLSFSFPRVSFGEKPFPPFF